MHSVLRKMAFFIFYKAQNSSYVITRVPQRMFDFYVGKIHRLRTSTKLYKTIHCIINFTPSALIYIMLIKLISKNDL